MTQAIYETFARMSQPFTNNLPEIDFHGANGNQILGGGAIAADRYTESRLAPIAEEGMLKTVDAHSVDMMLNFSEDEELPRVLPAVFPRLLVNGAQGIGVSIANTWLPHSFTETSNLILEYLKTGNLDSSEYYPDFPTGGMIVNKDELDTVNKTGRGRVILEASYTINKNIIDFYELPYQVYVEPVIEQIKTNIEKGKIVGIKDVINKSDKKRLLLSIICATGYKPETVLECLLSNTDLRKQFNANQVGMVGKTPTLKNLQETIDIYVKHNLECIKREFSYNADKLKERIYILEGLIVAIQNIDTTIKIIRTSNNAKQEIMDTFNLSDIQAKAILDMRLSKLSKLEEDSTNKELESKKEELDYCLSIVDSTEEQKKVLSDRLSDLVKKFGDKRRTKVIQKEIKKSAKYKKKEFVPEPVVIVYTEKGYIKSIPTKIYKSYKDNILIGKTDTSAMIYLISTLGKLYRISAKKIKQCNYNDKGTALGSILSMENEEKIICGFIKSEDNPYLIMVTRNGLVKKIENKEYYGSTQNLRGTKAMNLKNDDKIVSVTETTKESYITLNSKDGYAIYFADTDLSFQGKTAGGLKGINLNDGDEIISAAISSIKNTKLTLQKRGGKGKKLK